MATVQLDRELLVKLIMQNTGWSENHLTAFKEESLQEVYKYILKKQDVNKIRITYKRSGLLLHIPKSIRERLGLTPGDRFSLTTTMNKEVILDTESFGDTNVKLSKTGRVSLPLTLLDRRIIREQDDILIRVVGRKIVFKSFTYYQ